jgi:sugar phosphate isomerase/epimerase
MVRVGVITASYMWEGSHYANVPWNDLMEAFEKKWTPPRLDDLLGRIAAIKLPYIELWRVHVQNEKWDAAMVRDLMDKHGLTTASFCVGGVRSVEGLEHSYQYAKALGAPLLSGTVSATDTEKLLDKLEEYGDKYDLNYAIEPHGKANSVCDPAQYVEILAKRSGRIGVCPDPGWWQGQGFDPVAAVELLKERVYHTHLRCTLQASGERVASAEPVVRILKKSGYKGVYSIEHEPQYDPAADLAEAREFILRVAKA